MALNKTALKNEIKSLLDDMKTREQDSTEEFATRLSNAIDDYVKDLEIGYTTGLIAPSGAVTGTFTHTVS